MGADSYITIEGAAERLGVARRAIQYHIEKKTLKTHATACGKVNLLRLIDVDRLKARVARRAK